MKRLFHFILSHSIFISLCAAALSLQTLLILSLPVNAYLLAFIFFATLSGYNAYWITSKFSFNKYGSFFRFFNSNLSSILVMSFAVAGMAVCYVRLELVMYNIIITFVALALYAVPLLPVAMLRFTRKAGFVKTILLAFAWTMVTTLVPLQTSVTALDRTAWLIFIHRFLFMLTLCIIFDKRDAAVDKIRGLQSLATDIKPVVLNYLIAGVLAAYAWLSYLLHHHGVDIWQVTALLVTGLFTVWVYYSSFKQRGYIYYYFVVDGLMFLSGVLSLLASIS